MDATLLINLIFCIAIVLLGCWGYRKTGKAWPMFIAIGFGLLGLTHLLRLIGLNEDWEGLLIPLRVIGYSAVIYALYIGALKK